MEIIQPAPKQNIFIFIGDKIKKNFFSEEIHPNLFRAKERLIMGEVKEFPQFLDKNIGSISVLDINPTKSYVTIFRDRDDKETLTVLIKLNSLGVATYEKTTDPEYHLAKPSV